MPFSVRPHRHFPVHCAVTTTLVHSRAKNRGEPLVYGLASLPSPMETALSKFDSCSFGTDA